MVGQLVTVQLGQCGNQLGLDFFTSLAREGGREAGDATALTGCRPLHEHLPALFRDWYFRYFQLYQRFRFSNKQFLLYRLILCMRVGAV